MIEDFDKLASKIVVENPYLPLAEELKAMAGKVDDFIVVHGFTVKCSEAQVKDLQLRSKQFFDHLITCIDQHTKTLQAIAFMQSVEN